MPIRAPITCQLTPSQLRDKALLALEDAVQECRYRQPRRSFAMRFALTYLWAYSGADRRPFERFWETLGREKTPWNFGVANMEIVGIYRALGLDRPEEFEHLMWKRWAKREGSG